MLNGTATSRKPDRGFTLLETLVGVLIGMFMVAAIGVLGGNLIRHRANADSRSAALSLAERWLEQLLAAEPPSSAARCDADPRPVLCPGEHGPLTVAADGRALLSGPYRISWQVQDAVPPLRDVFSKRLSVTVTHETNPFAAASLATYRQIGRVHPSAGFAPGAEAENDQ